MTAVLRKDRSTSPRRSYLVHLLSTQHVEGQQGRYIVRIQPWAARRRSHSQCGERAFEDDCELIAAINPLLPPGSDVRDVFGLIESPNGFFYLLRLSNEQAQLLGWRP